MDETDPVADWMRRWGAGDQQAAELLFARYAARLTHLAERHLSRKLAAREGGEDVVQSVFRTFFRRSAEGEFQIDSSDQLWRLLVKITLRKARTRGRYHATKKRSADAEVRPEDDSWVAEVLARDPDPAEGAELVDLMECMLKDMPPLYCRVLELRLQGMVPADVARELNISRSTVRRALELFKQRLRECGGETPSEPHVRGTGPGSKAGRRGNSRCAARGGDAHRRGFAHISRRNVSKPRAGATPGKKSICAVAPGREGGLFTLLRYVSKPPRQRRRYHCYPPLTQAAGRRPDRLPARGCPLTSQ